MHAASNSSSSWVFILDGFAVDLGGKVIVVAAAASFLTAAWFLMNKQL